MVGMLSLQSVDAKMRKVYHERPALPQRVLSEVPEKPTSIPSDSLPSAEILSKPISPSPPVAKDPTPSSRSATSRRSTSFPSSYPASVIPGFDNFVRLNLKRHINVRRRRHAYSPVNSLPAPEETLSQIEDNDLPQQPKDGNGSGPGLLEEEVVELMMEKNPSPDDKQEDGRFARFG